MHFSILNCLPERLHILQDLLTRNGGALLPTEITSSREGSAHRKDVFCMLAVLRLVRMDPSRQNSPVVK